MNIFQNRWTFFIFDELFLKIQWAFLKIDDDLFLIWWTLSIVSIVIFKSMNIFFQFWWTFLKFDHLKKLWTFLQIWWTIFENRWTFFKFTNVSSEMMNVFKIHKCFLITICFAKKVVMCNKYGAIVLLCVSSRPKSLMACRCSD